jgi:hypothetical protein
MRLSGHEESDISDLDRLRLPDEMVGKLGSQRPPPLPRHGPGEAFIKGPIPHAWIASVCRLPGAGLLVAMAFRFLCSRFQRENRWGLAKIARGLRASLRSVQRGVHAAERAGLRSVSRKPGRKLVVSVAELPATGTGPTRRPLYGPIPWAWWLPASRLPEKSLQVASAVWFQAGWERSARIELALGEWGELGLSRFSVRRGLDALETAGLIKVERRPGWSPIVTIQNARNPVRTGPPDCSRPDPSPSDGSQLSRAGGNGEAEKRAVDRTARSGDGRQTGSQSPSDRRANCNA